LFSAICANNSLTEIIRIATDGGNTGLLTNCHSDSGNGAHGNTLFPGSFIDISINLLSNYNYDTNDIKIATGEGGQGGCLNDFAPGGNYLNYNFITIYTIYRIIKSLCF
jgi:hypothetical protein